jgi:hypothetical protein
MRGVKSRGGTGVSLIFGSLKFGSLKFFWDLEIGIWDFFSRPSSPVAPGTFSSQ